MRILNLLYKIFLFSFLSIIIIIIGLYSYSYFSPKLQLNSYHTYELYDIEENVFYEGNKNNRWTNINKISQNLKDAVVSVEDKNFYVHNGFDYLRIIKALFNNLKNKKIIEGGSTISQQYIKNAYLDFDKTWDRKIKEALMTLNLEVHYDKNEILEAYLNTINFGLGNYGIAEASAYYFNKKPKDLTLEESLILAGIPKSPSHYNPVSDYDKSIQRAKVVALTMVNNGLLSSEKYNNLFKNKIEIYGKKNDNNMQMLDYYEDAVYYELKNKLGFDDKMINSGKYKIYTNLNLDYQKKMEEELLNNMKDEKIVAAMPISEGHIVPIEPGSRMHAYFYTVKGIFSCEILVTERGKEGNIYIMEVECTTELKKFQRRQFYRLPCTIEGYFRKLTDTELLRFQHDNIVPEDTQDVDKGIIVDISGGGLRIMTEKPLEKNNYIYIRFPVEMNIGNRDIEVVGRVILSLESPNRKDCYDNRIQFKGISHELRETVVKYIFEQQRIIQRKERGGYFGKENTGN